VIELQMEKTSFVHGDMHSHRLDVIIGLDHPISSRLEVPVCGSMTKGLKYRCMSRSKGCNTWTFWTIFLRKVA
jgi:hypothetical protein